MQSSLQAPPDTELPTVRVLVVDDEPLAWDCVRCALQEEPSLEIIGECGSGEEAVAAIEKLHPDLVFLDVNMPGMDGFDVVERIGPESMPGVVFVTAHDDHALRAFEMHALDYVLKPFTDERLRESVRHARERLSDQKKRDEGEKLAALLGQIRDSREVYTKRFSVRDGDRVHFVDVEDVDWLEASGNYVIFHVGGDEYRLRVSLRRVLERLDPLSFVRVHRSTAVNVERVREVQRWFGGDYLAILEDGVRIRVSRTYKDSLLKPAF
jgi:two-component system LytT family response regulator